MSFDTWCPRLCPAGAPSGEEISESAARFSLERSERGWYFGRETSASRSVRGQSTRSSVAHPDATSEKPVPERWHRSETRAPARACGQAKSHTQATALLRKFHLLYHAPVLEEGRHLHCPRVFQPGAGGELHAPGADAFYLDAEFPRRVSDGRGRVTERRQRMAPSPRGGTRGVEAAGGAGCRRIG